MFVLNVRTLFMCALACAIVYLCESDHLDLRCAIWGVSLVLGLGMLHAWHVLPKNRVSFFLLLAYHHRVRTPFYWRTHRFRLDFSIISVGTIFPLVRVCTVAYRTGVLRRVCGGMDGRAWTHVPKAPSASTHRLSKTCARTGAWRAPGLTWLEGGMGTTKNLCWQAAELRSPVGLEPADWARTCQVWSMMPHQLLPPTPPPYVQRFTSPPPSGPCHVCCYLQVFAIQQAFTRRDEALKEMAFLKAQVRAGVGGRVQRVAVVEGVWEEAPVTLCRCGRGL